MKEREGGLEFLEFCHFRNLAEIMGEKMLKKLFSARTTNGKWLSEKKIM